MDGINTIKPIACFEVEKIIGVSKSSGNVLNYQVQWAPTWINGMHLVGCDRLVEEFLQQQLGNDVNVGEPVVVDGGKNIVERNCEVDNANRENCGELNNRNRTNIEADILWRTNCESDKRSKTNCETDVRKNANYQSENRSTMVNCDVNNEERNSTLENIVQIVKQEIVEDTQLQSAVLEPDIDHPNVQDSSNYDAPVNTNSSNYLSGGEHETALDNDSQIHVITPLDRISHDEHRLNSFLNNNMNNETCSTSWKGKSYGDRNNESYLTEKSINTGQGLEDIVLDISDDDHHSSDLIKAGETIERKRFDNLDRRVIMGNTNYSESYNANIVPPSSQYSHGIYNPNKFTQHYRPFESEGNFQPMDDYKCNVCGKAFRHKGNMQRHIRTAHTEKATRYTCHVCGKRCVQNMDLVRHMRKHTGEKPFWCTVCEKRFTRKATLVQHMSVHTKMY